MDLSNRRNLIIGIVVGLILGLLLGMVLFWGPFAVEWTNAHSYDLAPEARAQYVALVADSFKLDNDRDRAEAYLQAWEPEEKQEAIADAIEVYERNGEADKVQAMNDFAMALGISTPAEIPPTPPPVESPLSEPWNRLRVPCLVFVLVLLALVLALIGIRALQGRRTVAEDQVPGTAPAPATLGAEELEDVSQAPLDRFLTTYQLGEDTYDESFSIEAPTGEFLGECGMGISEIIGEGEPDKVTAFEVWLFDKSDIRTVTKVLMSNYAFYDETLRAKLAPKGEPVLAQPGSPVTLETSGLKVQVDVTDLVYDAGELPPESVFAKLMVELVAMAKPVETDANAV
jgi:hypothetical protein